MKTPVLKLTDTPCPRCLQLLREGQLHRPETVQRLPVGAMAPTARDGSGKCCFDCASADALRRITPELDFIMARISVGNDRQDQYRLPGAQMGLVAMGIVRPSRPGDLEDQHRWLKRNPQITELEP